ncbi:uncharacterized protein LOC107776493 [Nicotiana tabacum]|uniref:uncharacterized protein LOC107776493 n=1 Tax=Nicotiana tabacum TaxID=4097 RepID=UPI003F4F3372
MVYSEKQQSMDNREVNEVEQSHNGEELEESSSSTSAVVSTSTSGLTERLTEILVEEGDGDLLLQLSDRENNVMQWLQALDMQVMGACRADERLKPLLKMNVASGAAEDGLFSQLSQHFEPAEVGMLVRCLCIPLVSIRVGKIKKEGTLLCPTTTRGNLNLTVLPTSELRISFIGDDGSTERLATFFCQPDCAAVEIKDIMADNSGRSFLINIPDGETSYFWCSEKSKLLGDELKRKMKDLLKKKPSLAELTGISESRIDCFAIRLRAYLIGSAVTNAQSSSMPSTNPSGNGRIGSCEHGLDAQTSVTFQKPQRSRHYSVQGPKSSPLNLGSLSPRSSSFKESLLRNSSSLRNGKDRLRRRGDSNSYLDRQTPTPGRVDVPSSVHVQDEKLPGEANPTLASELLVTDLPFVGSAAIIPSLDSTVFSPYYCWCPPAASTQYSVGTPHLPILSKESFSLPQLSSMATARSSSILTPKLPLTVTNVSTLDLPPLLPDPLIRLPLSLPASQQIPSFTPLMCDPIVHIPVIDVCSSGQGYLVSAGPSISGTLPPLHPSIVNPLIPQTESVLEKNARETLRLLINGSNQPSTQLIDVLPSVLSSNEQTQNMLGTGSRGLYSGSIDVGTIANGFATRGLMSLSERPLGRVSKWQFSTENIVDQVDRRLGSGELDEGFTDIEEEN